MGFVTGYEYIITTSNNTIYNFFLDEKLQLRYISTNEEGKWANKNSVFTEEINSFSVEIDSLDQIHILAYTKTGKVYYLHLQNNKWFHREIEDYPTSAFLVYYPLIKIVDDDVHVFYYLHSKDEKNCCNLIHLALVEDVWEKKSTILTTYKKFINPFHIFASEDYLYILNSSVEKENAEIFIHSYSIEEKEWKISRQITHSSIDKVYLYSIFNQNTGFHIVWSEHNHEGLVVKYINLSEKNIEDTPLALTLSEMSNCSFPILLYYKDILWCVWTQMNKLYSCYSIDEGKSWSNPTVRQESLGINFRLYGYRTNADESRNTILCNYLFGSLYPKIQFIGFGGENYDEV